MTNKTRFSYLSPATNNLHNHIHMWPATRCPEKCCLISVPQHQQRWMFQHQFWSGAGNSDTCEWAHRGFATAASELLSQNWQSFTAVKICFKIVFPCDHEESNLLDFLAVISSVLSELLSFVNSVCGTDLLSRALCLLAPEQPPRRSLGCVSQPPAWGCLLAPPWGGLLPAFLMVLLPSCGADLNVLWARAKCPLAQQAAAGWVRGQARGGSLGENRDCHPGLAPCLWFLLPLLHQLLPFVQHWSTSTWQSSSTDYQGVFWGGCFLSKMSVLHLPSA